MTEKEKRRAEMAKRALGREELQKKKNELIEDNISKEELPEDSSTFYTLEANEEEIGRHKIVYPSGEFSKSRYSRIIDFLERFNYKALIFLILGGALVVFVAWYIFVDESPSLPSDVSTTDSTIVKQKVVIDSAMIKAEELAKKRRLDSIYRVNAYKEKISIFFEAHEEKDINSLESLLASEVETYPGVRGARRKNTLLLEIRKYWKTVKVDRNEVNWQSLELLDDSNGTVYFDLEYIGQGRGGEEYSDMYMAIMKFDSDGKIYYYKTEKK